MARTFKTLLFFLLISMASVSAQAGSLIFTLGWYPVMPWGTYFFPWTYYGYLYHRAPLYAPVKLPDIPLTNSLIALGETKRRTWEEAKNPLPASPNTHFPLPQDHKQETPDIPKIKIDKSSEFSMNAY